MTKVEAKKRIEKLREEINHHRFLYHVQDTQEISDAALDSLKKELETLEQEYPDLITSDSPTQRVGGEALEKFAQVTHTKRMLSLVDAFTNEDLIGWETRNKKIIPGEYNYFAQLKIDGVALALIYKDSILQTAATRGDGTTGEDVTHNVKTIEAIPLKLREKTKGEVEVRGEVYILKKDFEAMNKEREKKGEARAANPRNIAAGSIRQLDPKIAASRPLRFFAWEITRGISLKTRNEEEKVLNKLGFATPPDAKLFKSLQEITKQLAKLDAKRDKYPFLVDGLVIKNNSLEISKRLGTVGKAPRSAIAYKFAAEEATTVVEDIVVQVGRTGALTPVAHLRPVQVAGTTVSRASLHNADEIQRKDIRVGDTVIIRKAGDIIPEVLASLPKLRPRNSKQFKMPTRCPICDSQISKDKEGVVVRCTSKTCFPQQRERIQHAVSRQAFDIEGLGEKIVEQLLQEGLIKTAADLWDLKPGDLEPLEGFAKKSAENLVNEVQSHKSITLPRFLVSLSIPNIGVVTAVDLAREFKTLDKILSASAADLAEINGIGQKVAPGIIEYLNNPDTQALIDQYLKAGIQIKSEKNTGKLASKAFVFTGNLGDLTRDEAKQLVIQNGGKVASSVSKKIDYVVVGNDPGSKAKKAKDLAVKIITPEQFKKLIELPTNNQ